MLEDGHAFRDAAQAVKTEWERGVGVVVVVSALKGMTDKLLRVAEGISQETPRDMIDHIIGLGEEQSTRLMASALKGLGVDAVEITPDSPSWPIVTDEAFGDAEPIFEECKNNVELGLRPLVKRGKVPVVCGFTGRSITGNITTLGRGGSDTTAVILARCLGADEVILVKDVEGKHIVQLALSRDPGEFMAQVDADFSGVEFEAMPGNMLRAHTATTLPLGPLVRFFEEHGVDVTEAKAIRPSLEDVFVRITGIAAERMRKEKEQGKGKGGGA